MPEWILSIIGILIFIAIFFTSIVIHESAHAVIAKLLKIKLKEFYIGFGSKVYSFTRNCTEYGVRLIPLGGFIKIEDTRYPEKSYERLSLSRIKPWKRICVFAAGPLINIIIGSILIVSAVMTMPYAKQTNIAGAVMTCEASLITTGKSVCGAFTAGINPGSEIIEIDGRSIKESKEISESIFGQDTVTIKTNVNSKIEEYSVKITDGQMGVSFTTELDNRSLSESLDYLQDVVHSNLNAFQKVPETAPSVATSIVTGERDAEAPSSVISTGKEYSDVAVSESKASHKMSDYILLAGLFNLSLGIVNLLPFLPLDGGRIVIALIDSIKRQYSKLRKIKYLPVNEKFVKIISIIFGSLLLGFMALLIFSDLSLLLRGRL